MKRQTRRKKDWRTQRDKKTGKISKGKQEDRKT
jgi:hypothetical protein